MNRLIIIFLIVLFILFVGLLASFTYIYTPIEKPELLERIIGEKNEYDNTNSIEDIFYSVEYKNTSIGIRLSKFSNIMDSEYFFEYVLNSSKNEILFTRNYDIDNFSGLIVRNRNVCNSSILRQGNNVLIFSCIEDETVLKEVIEWFIEKGEF